MDRREFLGVLFPLAAIRSVEAPSSYSIPSEWIQRYKLQPVQEGVPDSRIVCRGEDGRLYRLTDVLRILFSRHSIRR